MNLELLRNFAIDCSARPFFGLPTWYEYLDVQPITTSTGEICKVVVGSNLNNVLLIGLAIVDILLRIGAMVAVGFIVYGGVRYTLSQGEPENAKNARKTILNAVIGVVIMFVASGLVSFIAKQLTRAR